MQKHMGGLIKTILDIKHRVFTLEKGDIVDHKKEIDEIMEKWNLIDKATAVNVDAIKDIDKEILTLRKRISLQKDALDNGMADGDRKKGAAKKDTI